MGLGFASIAQSDATPYWQALAGSGAWTDPEMGFFLQRYRGVVGAQSIEPEGGVFTIGSVELYTTDAYANYG